MDEQQREFKGIWIPREIWLDTRLNALDKIIFAEIDSYSNGKNGCYAGNDYLALFCQCSESKVSKTISKLIELGYVKRVSFDGRHRVLQSCLVNFTTLDDKKCQSANQSLPAINIDNNTGNNINYNSPLTPQGEKAAEEKPKPKKEKVDKDAPLVSLCKAYSTDPEVQGMLLEWLDVRKQKRAVKSVNAIQRNLAILKDMAQQSGLSVKQYLEEVVRRGWQAFYVVPNYGNNSQQKRLPTEDDYCDLWG